MSRLFPVSKKHPKLSLVALVAFATLVVGGSLLAAGGRPHAEAPMQVMTQGLSVEEHIQRMADLSRGLAAELAAIGSERSARVALSAEEIAAIHQSPRGAVPLKIGLVKPLSPGAEVLGLSFGPSDAQPGRGAIGAARPTPDGGAGWALVVRSEGAGAIRIHVEGLSLPRNGALYFYTRNGQAYGPYTGAGPNGNGDFWTATVFGTEAILQLRVTGPVRDEDLRGITFRIVEAGLITQRFAGRLQDPVVEAPPPPGFCGNASCIVDATCFSGTPADPAKLAVAKMEWIQGAFIYTCTGGLISDNNPTQNNFFLTANHCVSKNNTAQNVNFYWRFATSTCNGTCPSNGGWPYLTSGSTVSKTNRKGDFTLLHLNTNPPAGSVFLGWTNAPVANSNGTQLWRISNPDFGPQVYSQHNVDTGAPTCSGWPRGERIYSRDITGATDGGSSGSPVVNSASQIVGQLSGSCGFNVNDPCDSASNATVDGAFAFYYSQVQPILNP